MNENMSLTVLEFEAEKERRLWDNLRSKSSPTRPSQPHNECGYESPNTNNKVDIDMTIAEYNLYIARQMKNPLNNHSYSFSPQFFAQPPNTPNTPEDKKDSDFDEILDDLFSVGAKNLRRMGREKVQMGGMLTHPGIQTIKAEVEGEDDDDDGDTYDIWDITVDDVERIRQFLMPIVPNEMDDVIQPLIPQPIHTRPPNDDYVALATKSILDELLEEFRDEIMNVTMDDKEAVKDP
ncbi:hypothetical protein Tco_0214163 [Tanacetum coccineum]